ncbi:ABC transporter permease [Methanobrevibacter sp.]|uniref:ABC transporter permease n=1 Tax=Methanobrevibacter sp. TaxID=66852 RepID=UPI0026DF6AFB|nr:ABC transporter permease [Methanobrevibacter sp.]MDO5823786.1 ABC transporter permease [Methanobrevibacter sp.]
MLIFIQTEFIKLKNSKLFFLSLLSGLIPPFLMYMGVLEMRSDTPSFILKFSEMFIETNLYMTGLFAVFILCIIISYLIGREYNEHTLKLVLTSPISDFEYLIGKYIVFLIWTLLLFGVTFIGTLIFGFLGGGVGLTLNMALHYLGEMLFGGFLLSLVMTPFIFLSMIMKNIVPSMIAGSVLILANLLSYSCSWGPYLPWMASYIVSSNTVSQYPCRITTPLLAIAITFLFGIAISYIYFSLKDV